MSKREIACVIVVAVLGTAAGAVWQWRIRPLRAIRAAGERGDWSTCLELAKKELNSDSGCAAVLSWGARAALELGLCDSAQQYTDLLDRPSAMLLRRLGEGFAEQARWSKALVVFERLRALYPDDVQATRKLAAVHFKLGRWDLARRFAESLEGVPGQTAAAHCILGAIDSAVGYHTEAVRHLRQALADADAAAELPVSRAELSLLLGQSLLQLAQITEAESYLWEAAAAQPSVEACHLLALARLNQRDAAGALLWASQVLERDRRHAPTFEVLGLLAEQHNRPAEAVGWYRLAIQHANEPRAGLHYALAQAYLRLDRRDLAAPHLARMAQLQKDEQLRDAEDRVLAQEPDGPQALYIGAQRAIRQGDLVQAEERMRELFARFPDRPEVKSLKQRIEAHRVVSKETGSQD